MNQRLRIGIAEMHCARAPGLLVTHGLGSCLGITLYDATARIGAMAHTLLPERACCRGFWGRAAAKVNSARWIFQR